MKLTYKILWLDDVIQDFIDDEIIEEIENHLIEKGFNPEIITASNTDHFFEKLDNSYDLILTDYHLNEMNGDEVIEKIRSQEYAIMTEILFYTARADLKDTERISRVSFLETNGLLGDHRELVQKAVINLIDLTVRKFDDIVAMRGMIMHETSTLDVTIQEVLTLVINNGNTEQILDVIKKKYLNSNGKFAKRVETCTDINELLYFIGAGHRIRGLLRNTRNGEIKDILNVYTSEIITVRNQFAHAVLDTTKNVFITKNGKEFNEELCRQIRKNIVKHKDNLARYKSDLN